MTTDNTTVSNATIEEMFRAGAHFGYSKSKRHPSAKGFIFTTKSGSDIINLEKTYEQLEAAKAFIKGLASSGKVVLFVGTKPEARATVSSAAESLNMPFVSERWIGGTLTNFSEIKKRIERLDNLKTEKETDGFAKYTKKERLLIEREIGKLEKFFAGISSLKKMPEAIVIIDSKKEDAAVDEAKQMKVHVISLSNSDTNFKGITCPIVANDASKSSVAFFIGELTGAYKEGQLSAPTSEAK